MRVQACTFFRNFGSNRAALLVQNVWPLVYVCDGTDWIQNDNLIIQHEYIEYYVEVADLVPEAGTLRGTALVTITDTHYDGGHASDGVVVACIPSAVIISGNIPDQPDAHWITTIERTTWVDHGMYIGMGVLYIVWPPNADKQHPADFIFVDSSVTDAVGLAPRESNSLASCWIILTR